MFTGIIQAVAEIRESKTDEDITTLTIQKPSQWKLEIGQSIATEGVCLTVVRFNEEAFDVELMPESMKRTHFGSSMPKRVNLERAMSAQALFEGHIVQGHVDTVGTVTAIEQSEQWRTLHISFESMYDKYCVEKGSITINGVSLTIVDTSEGTLSVSLIPHTISHTTFDTTTQGDQVNLEFDIIAKLINKQNT